MQGQKRARRPSAKIKRPTSLFVLKGVMIIQVIVAIIGGTILLKSDLPLAGWLHHVPTSLLTNKTLAINGTSRWDGDVQATVPTFPFSFPTVQTVSLSPLFSPYYQDHDGANSLGNPLTVAFPTDNGWLQFFASGALLLPAIEQKHGLDTEDTFAELIDNGTRDLETGVVRLPLLQALLTVGSQEPVGGDGSPLTYVDLRKAASPNLLVLAPVASSTASTTAVGSQSVFIKGGVRAGKAVGHLITSTFWRYINRPDISPDGWATDFGAPLTEALSFTMMKNGTPHQMQVQVFWRDAVLLDQSSLDPSGQPEIQRLDTSLDYLRTLGPPPVSIGTQQTMWVQGDTTLLDGPNTGQPVAHIGLNFPLTPLGDATWNAGMLWYHVQWSAPKHSDNGWVPATSVTLKSPSNGPAWASLDLLSPDLAAYLANLGGNVGVVAYDITRQRYYTYNANAQLMMASSMKVPIMLTFFDMIEQQGREPNDNEMELLTTMIENSDNDSASALYYDEIGGATGVANYLQKIGITGLTPNADAWGYSEVTSQAMVNMLTLLYNGKILTANHRTLALSLMEQVESDQQVGVGDTAPQGATVAMKDGWVTDDNNLWVVNSSGIVTVGQETYIIAVYTQGQAVLDDGQTIVRHVCSSVATQLI